MSTRLMGKAASGHAQASQTLRRAMSLIETRSELQHLIAETFNVQLPEPFSITPDFHIKKGEYGGTKDLFFQHCRMGDIPCLIMRPDNPVHPAEIIELMSGVWLRRHFGLSVGSTVVIEIDRL